MFLLKIYPHQPFYGIVHFQNCYNNHINIYSYFSFVIDYLNIFSLSLLSHPCQFTLSNTESLPSLDLLHSRKRSKEGRNQSTTDQSKIFLFFSISLSPSLQSINLSTHHHPTTATTTTTTNTTRLQYIITQPQNQGKIKHTHTQQRQRDDCCQVVVVGQWLRVDWNRSRRLWRKSVFVGRLERVSVLVDRCLWRRWMLKAT